MIRAHRPQEGTGAPQKARTGGPALDALADRLRRLLPSHRDPEAFHVEKDEIERALRRIARRL